MQVFIGLFTWLVVIVDDRIEEMKADVEQFQKRFTRGQVQARGNLEALADILRESHDHFDAPLANLLVTSTLDFLTSNVLDTRKEFKTMPVTPDSGRLWPYYYRNMSGITTGFAVFCFPKELCPDISCYLEAIPDLSVIINVVNDVLS